MERTHWSGQPEHAPGMAAAPGAEVAEATMAAEAEAEATQATAAAAVVAARATSSQEPPTQHQGSAPSPATEG